MKIVRLDVRNVMGVRAVEIEPDPSGNLVLVAGRNGAGKQAPISEPVLTPDGWKPIGEIQVGDEVIGSAGLPVKVLAVYPQTSREVWQVAMADGGTTRCGPEHLWTVGRWKGEWTTETLTTAELMEIGVRMNGGRSRRWAVPLPEPIAYSERTETLPVEPWALGVLLGDAHIAETGYAQLTTDAEIIDRLGATGYRRPHGASAGIDILGSASWSFRLEALGLAGKRSPGKFVPTMYLRASASERRALLAGLLDTDGTTDRRPTGASEFTSTSEALADAVVELTRSLGGTAKKSGPRQNQYTYAGERKLGLECWFVYVKTPFNPFTLSRKAEKWLPAGERRPLRRYIDRIERVADEDCVCIRVDAEDGLYVTKDFIVTHNSSILEAIWLALGGGTASRATVRPVRNGAKDAEVTLDLGDLKVTRTWTAGGEKSALRVQAANGALYPSPQKLLDGLVGRVSFDPVAFTLMQPREQRAELLKLLSLPLDPDEKAAKRRALYEERTAVNRGMKALKAQLDAIPEPAAGLPEREQSSAEVLAQLRAAQAANDERARLVDEHTRLGDELAAAMSEIEALRRQIGELGQARETVLMRLSQEPEPADPAVFEHQLTDLEATNRAVRAAQERAALAVEHAAAASEADALTEQMEDLDREVADALAAADKPVEGLGFDEDGVTYRGVPFGQCSAAERLRVSVAMAMSANPTLRVLRIKDGSLLDDDNMALIAAMAAEHNAQVWLEVVGDGGPTAFVIEDGSLRAAEAVPA